jgi:hypothetical protein
MPLTQKLDEKIYQLKKVYQYVRYVRPFTAENKRQGSLTGRTNISIFSEPRGGSTWMGEVFCKLPGSILISEPMFLLPPYREIRDVKFCFNQFIPEDAEWPEAEEYFRKLYNMEIGSFSAMRLYYFNRDLRDISKAKYFVYKDVNSNMLLAWVTKRFDINPVYLIRHPCAVIASQLKYKHWDYILKDVKAYFPNEEDRHKEIYETYQDIINTISKPEERLAAEWALHNIVPIKHPENDKRWITVAYEKMYKEPEAELSRVFERLNIEMPADILDEIKKPSITAIEGSKSAIHSGNQIESWRKFLSASQVNNILHITREFGIDFYDESPEPDYSKIYAR